MSEGKYTPGDWFLNQSMSPKWDEKDDVSINVLIDGKPLVIAVAFAMTGPGVIQPAWANAQLMVAAPTLLKACHGGQGARENALADNLDFFAKAIEKDMFKVMSRKTAASVLRQYAVILRDAIAKAEGRS